MEDLALDFLNNYSMKYLIENDYDRLKRILFALMVSVVVFSSLSYTLAFPFYILVPLTGGFLLSFIFGDRRESAIYSISIVSLASLIFSGVGGASGFGSPAEIVAGLVAERQRQMLTFSPALLSGIMGGVMGWGMGTVIREKKWEKIALWTVFVLLCLNMVFFSLDLNPDSTMMASMEPKEGEYNNFNSVYLKTFFLMKKGEGFYESLAHAYSGRAESRGMCPVDVWAWRLPAVFYLWSYIMPLDGFYIYYLYLLAGVMILYFSMDVAGGFLRPPFNLLAPMMISPLLIFGAVGFWFAFPEIWGLLSFMMGIWALKRGDLKLAMVGFALAPVFSLFFLVPWLGAVGVLLWKRGRSVILPIIISLAVMAVYYGAHFFFIGRYGSPVLLPAEISSGFRWIGLAGILGFGSVLYSRYLMLIGICIILSVFSPFRLYRSDTGMVIVCSCLLSMLVFLFLGGWVYRPYWGIICLPLMFILSASAPVNVPQEYRMDESR